MKSIFFVLFLALAFVACSVFGQRPNNPFASGIYGGRASEPPGYDKCTWGPAYWANHPECRNRLN